MLTQEIDPQPTTPQRGDTPDDAEKLRRRQRAGEMSAIFGGLDRLVTLLRVYPMSHPLVDGFAQQLAQRTNALVEVHGPMMIQIGATELRTEWGDRFFSQENSERDHFIWLQPFSDGPVVRLHSTGHLLDLASDEHRAIRIVALLSPEDALETHPGAFAFF